LTLGCRTRVRTARDGPCRTGASTCHRYPVTSWSKVWTIRGAPHVYRRERLPLVAAAVESFSQADAGKRIFDAANPLKVAGISNLDGLDAVAAAMRSVVTKPMAKGDVSTQVTALMDPVHLRFCRACNATHFVRDAVFGIRRCEPAWSWSPVPLRRCSDPFPASRRAPRPTEE
jgi:hypothetical protein